MYKPALIFTHQGLFVKQRLYKMPANFGDLRIFDCGLYVKV